MTCRRYGFIWKVAGSFIRSLINEPALENTCDIELKIYLTSTNSMSSLTNFIQDMELMGSIQSKTQVDLFTTVCDIRVVLEEGPCNFLAVFTINQEPEICFSTDSVYLTKEGLVSIKLGFHDYYNRNKGLVLLDRLIDIKSKQTQRIKTYANECGNPLARNCNASMMFAESKYVEEGYEILGSTLFKEQDGTHECPICMDDMGKAFTTLNCGHSFCLNCLAGHMCQAETRSGQCPMCRGGIVLRVNHIY